MSEVKRSWYKYLNFFQLSEYLKLQEIIWVILEPRHPVIGIFWCKLLYWTEDNFRKNLMICVLRILSWVCSNVQGITWEPSNILPHWDKFDLLYHFIKFKGRVSYCGLSHFETNDYIKMDKVRMCLKWREVDTSIWISFNYLSIWNYRKLSG